MKITTNTHQTPTVSATIQMIAIDFQWLPGNNCHTLVCNRNVLCVFSFLSHQLLQRYVHKGQDLIKLIAVTASPCFFLRVELKNAMVTSIVGATALD